MHEQSGHAGLQARRLAVGYVVYLHPLSGTASVPHSLCALCRCASSSLCVGEYARGYMCVCVYVCMRACTGLGDAEKVIEDLLNVEHVPLQRKSGSAAGMEQKEEAQMHGTEGSTEGTRLAAKYVPYRSTAMHTYCRLHAGGSSGSGGASVGSEKPRSAGAGTGQGAVPMDRSPVRQSPEPGTHALCTHLY